jgi:hypothetical protein
MTPQDEFAAPAPVPDPDERDLNRRLAVRFNNEAWDLLEGYQPEQAADPPSADRDRLRYDAYAAARHWLEVGGPVEQARAKHLISRAELVAGSTDEALLQARACLDLLRAHRTDAADWDWPFAHEALARALAATGDRDGGLAHRRTAERLTRGLAVPQDAEILDAELRRPPWFGLDRGEGGESGADPVS